MDKKLILAILAILSLVGIVALVLHNKQDA